jgi:hypothetical protein
VCGWVLKPVGFCAFKYQKIKIIIGENMKINKGGRPPKKLEEKRSVAIKFSCTASENKFIEQHAEAAGYKQTALFLHDFFIKSITEGKFTYIKQNEINREWVNELNAIGNNVNQLAHSLHLVDVNGQDSYSLLDKNFQLLIQLIAVAAGIATRGEEEQIHLNNNNKSGEENGNT